MVEENNSETLIISQRSVIENLRKEINKQNLLIECLHEKIRELTKEDENRATIDKIKGDV